MSSDSPGHSRPPLRVGPYRIEGQIGVGGMGAVYRARDERLKRPVAIKHILPDIADQPLRERFRREAQAAASLNHTAIVHIYDIVEDSEGDWIVMELVEGERLDRLLRAGPLELPRALRLAREISRGLAEAHGKGIVHRDLKAENVMVTAGGHAKILDFGLAKLAREPRDPDLSTQDFVLGTARVMSPEQAMGLGIDHRSDLFSLGTLFYEIFTGRSPFRGEAVVDTLKKVCTLRQAPAHTWREGLPPELSELIDHLLEKEPEKRPRSAREVIAVLMKIAGAEIPEGAAGPRARAPEPSEEGREALARDFLDSGDPEQDREGLSPESDAGEPDPRDSTTVPHRPLAASVRRIPGPGADDRGAPRAPSVSRPAVEPAEAREPSECEPGEERAPAGGTGADYPRPVASAPPDTPTVSRTWALEATAVGVGLPRQLGEKRQLTVVCCDLLGERSGASFGILDPELLYEVMPDFRALAHKTIEHFEGHLGKILGHRLWAYFGYPRAHEDDAERAVRAALELVERVHELGASTGRGGAAPGAARLALRAGIHTGPAVVTPLQSSEDEIALGSTLELAAGIHELAAPHDVVVSDVTRRLIEDHFASESLGPVRLKGFARPRTAHRILEVRDARGLLDRFASSSSLVGRGPELEILLGLWQEVRRGSGQVVFLSGGGGIGKSRLVRALKERLADDAPPWWTAFASPFTRSSPLSPVAAVLRSLLDDDSGASLVDRLEKTLERHGFSLPELVPLFADLLALPLGGRYPPPSSTPARQRARTLEALAALFLEKAERQPAVMVIEDLQWADPSTLELLDLLLDQVPASPLLLLLTHRPEFDLPWEPRDWEPRTDVTRLELEPLGRRESAALVDLVAAENPLPQTLRQQIVDRTDGVPLFIEELTKTVLDVGAEIDSQEQGAMSPSTPLYIPTTLRDSLTARLDRLGTARALAQRAAVIGREFSRELLSAVSRLDETALRRDLERLLSAEHVDGDPAGRRYSFRHALIQEAAYESLLKRERREVHLEIARALEKGLRGEDPAPPEVLARHYTRAHVPEKAAAYWLESGRTALARSANMEAIDHLRKGLMVLGGLPPGSERDSLELSLECALIPALIAVEGYTAPEVEQVMNRAYDLCREIGDTPRLFWAVRALWSHHFLRGESPRALELAEQLLRLAEDDADLGLHARYTLGSTLYYRADYAAAREHLERGVDLDTPERGRAGVLHAGQEAGVTTRSVLALALWHLGRPDRALELSGEALARARELGHPYTLAFALHADAWVLLYRRDAETLLQRAQELVEYCREQDLWLVALGNFQLRCALTELRLRAPEQGEGDPADLVIGMERAVQGLLTTGVGLAQTIGLCHLAESYLRLGRPDESRRFLTRAFELLENREDRHWAPELYRIQGELALHDGVDRPDRKGEAEDFFQQSLAEAKHQGDRALALRTAVRLSRLWRDQGLEAEARGLLARVCDGFGEGYETPDWIEAQEALASLT